MLYLFWKWNWLDFIRGMLHVIKSQWYSSIVTYIQRGVLNFHWYWNQCLWTMHLNTVNIFFYMQYIFILSPLLQKIRIISYQWIKNSYHFQLASNFNVFIDRTLQSRYSPMCDHNDISSVSLYVIYNLCCKKKKTKNILWYM